MGVSLTACGDGAGAAAPDPGTGFDTAVDAGQGAEPRPLAESPEPAPPEAEPVQEVPRDAEPVETAEPREDAQAGPADSVEVGPPQDEESKARGGTS